MSCSCNLVVVRKSCASTLLGNLVPGRLPDDTGTGTDLFVHGSNSLAAQLKETLEGWSEDISKCTKWEDLPDNARKYVLRPGVLRHFWLSVVSVELSKHRSSRIQELLGIPVSWVPWPAKGVRTLSG